MIASTRYGWIPLLAMALLMAACSGTAAPTSTTSAPPGQSSDLQQQVANQQAQIRELEQTVTELTDELARVRSQLTRTQLHWDACAAQFANRQYQEATCLEQRDAFSEWVQQEVNRYQSELEQLRGLVPLPDTPEARQSLQTLEAFLAAVRDGRYTTAVSLYGGTYESLIGSNPSVDPTDKTALFQSACEYQLRCDLALRRVLAGSIVANGYEFYVEFQTDDGQLFSLGPCCGSDTDPTVSQFAFVVTQTPEGPRVLTPPLYTP